MRAAAACALLLAAATAGAARAAGGTGPVAASRPAVTGVLQQGKKLTANPGTWTGSGTIGYAYQWYRCDALGAHCSSIHGSTRATYTEVAKDAGKTLGLTVRATDTTGTAFGYATLTGVVAAATSRLVATAQPPLSGDPIVGRPLRAEAASWSTPPASTSVAWLRCNVNARSCVPIAGATAAAYTVTAGDVGHTLVAAATGTTGATRQTVLSVSSGVARTLPGPVAASRPSIAGTLQQGKRLTANAGTWSGSGTVAYAYQWYRCDALVAHCSSIHGATKPTYTQVAADAGKTIALTVRATDATGTTPAYASAAGIVATATASLTVTAQPTLSGTAAPGQALKVTGGTFAVTPSSATYAWLRCNANGRLCAAIAGATSDTYTMTAADAGHALVARVTARSGSASQAALTTAAFVPA